MWMLSEGSKPNLGMPEKPAGQDRLRKLYLHLLVHLLHEHFRVKRRPKVIAALMRTGFAGIAVSVFTWAKQQMLLNLKNKPDQL